MSQVEVWTPETCNVLTSTLMGYGLVPTRNIIPIGGVGTYSILVSPSKNMPRFGKRHGDAVRTWLLTFQPAATEDFELAVAEELHRWGILQFNVMDQEKGETNGKR